MTNKNINTPIDNRDDYYDNENNHAIITMISTIPTTCTNCHEINNDRGTYEIELIEFRLHVGKQYEDIDNIESFTDEESLISVEDEWTIDDVVQTSTRNYVTSL